MASSEETIKVIQVKCSERMVDRLERKRLQLQDKIPGAAWSHTAVVLYLLEKGLGKSS